jgi:hypothetical protein
MANRIRIHVRPSGRGHAIEIEGTPGVPEPHETREEAVCRARELAQRHEFSVVIVHGADGRVEAEYPYGLDSDYPSKG